MSVLPIGGLAKSSLIDYPGKVAATVFVSGCNFRCPFCHNPELVNASPKTIQVMGFLEKRKPWLDAVCITGGEPTIYSGLKPFIKGIKNMGYLVKLDTNGSNPGLLKELLEFVDWVAMDIKTALDKYREATGVDVNIENVKKSRDMLLNADGLTAEFRTTVVPGFVDKKDFEGIASFIEGARLFSIQQFDNTSEMLDPKMNKIVPYDKEVLKDFKTIAKRHAKEVKIVSM